MSHQFAGMIFSLGREGEEGELGSKSLHFVPPQGADVIKGSTFRYPPNPNDDRDDVQRDDGIGPLSRIGEQQPSDDNYRGHAIGMAERQARSPVHARARWAGSPAVSPASKVKEPSAPLAPQPYEEDDIKPGQRHYPEQPDVPSRPRVASVSAGGLVGIQTWGSVGGHHYLGSGGGGDDPTSPGMPLANTFTRRQPSEAPVPKGLVSMPVPSGTATLSSGSTAFLSALSGSPQKGTAAMVRMSRSDAWARFLAYEGCVQVGS